MNFDLKDYLGLPELWAWRQNCGKVVGKNLLCQSGERVFDVCFANRCQSNSSKNIFTLIVKQPTGNFKIPYS